MRSEIDRVVSKLMEEMDLTPGYIQADVEESITKALQEMDGAGQKASKTIHKYKPTHVALLSSVRRRPPRKATFSHKSFSSTGSSCALILAASIKAC